jgi:IS605 OrfB family transposase
MKMPLAAVVPAFLHVLTCNDRCSTCVYRVVSVVRFSTKLVKEYQNIVIGDVSSRKLIKTRMAKSVLDAGWGILKTQLQYKGQQAGRCVSIVNERDTTRTCYACKALTGPSGIDMLVVRTWVCSACGVTHDRDVNSARNMLSAGRSPPSVSGNEPSVSEAPPIHTSSRCEAWNSALKRRHEHRSKQRWRSRAS